MHDATAQVREIDWLPDLLPLHEFAPQRYPHLLESVAHGTAEADAQSRYDILFAFPGETLAGDGFLGQLDAAFLNQSHPTSDRSIPFRGGWFVYLGYELAAEVEPTLAMPIDPDGGPVAFATRFPAAVVRDRLRRRCWLVGETEAQIETLRADIAALDFDHIDDTTLDVAAIHEASADVYLHALQRIHDYIVEGDVFQVNLSRPWHIELGTATTPATLYRRLRAANPAPFAALATFGERAIVSSSPERLVSVSGNRIDTRPIAGTRRRDANAIRDAALRAELIAHPKERAEHIMLIDLERNDLGRVCEPGSVEVNELMVLESYAHVHHIVSNVRGRLRPGVTPGDVIRAVFPGGTITGCPKVRCMQIIAELEGEGRGAYTGSIGYLNRDGDMDLNILIRTIEQHGKHLRLRAGAGIVVDSRPEQELAETRNKARGMLLALGVEA